LILHTDSVTEALNGEGEMFGDDRLREVIAASLGASANGTICGALAAFTGGAEPADDVTVVVVRRWGKESNRLGLVRVNVIASDT
jgi:phosphoserine phosphatase RsbU/P